MLNNAHNKENLNFNIHQERLQNEFNMIAVFIVPIIRLFIKII